MSFFTVSVLLLSSFQLSCQAMDFIDTDVSEACMEENKITPEILLAFMKTGPEADEGIQTNVFCSLKCSLDKQNMLNTNGELRMDSLVKKMNGGIAAENMGELLDCLKRIPPINECEDINPMYKCFKTLEIDLE